MIKQQLDRNQQVGEILKDGAMRAMRRFRWGIFVVLAAAGPVGFAACADRDRQQPTGPSFGQASPQGPSRILSRFPEMVEFLPAIRIATDDNPLQPERSDGELVEDVRRAGGHVMIGLKPASARRTGTCQHG